jgi:hypothetical protein
VRRESSIVLISVGNMTASKGLNILLFPFSKWQKKMGKNAVQMQYEGFV